MLVLKITQTIAQDITLIMTCFLVILDLQKSLESIKGSGHD